MEDVLRKTDPSTRRVTPTAEKCLLGGECRVRSSRRLLKLSSSDRENCLVERKSGMKPKKRGADQCLCGRHERSGNCAERRLIVWLAGGRAGWGRLCRVQSSAGRPGSAECLVLSLGLGVRAPSAANLSVAKPPGAWVARPSVKTNVSGSFDPRLSFTRLIGVAFWNESGNGWIGRQNGCWLSWNRTCQGDPNNLSVARDGSGCASCA